MAAWHYIKGRWWIFAIPLIVSTFIGGAMIYFDTIGAPEMRPPRPWHQSLLFLGIVFIVFPWISMLWTIMRIRRGQMKETDLLEKGIRGQATIVSVEETGLYTNDIPEIEMVLDVRSGVHPDRRIICREHVNLIDLPRLIPGKDIIVILDPDDNENILVLPGDVR